MASLICPVCTTLQRRSARRCCWCDTPRPPRGWLTGDDFADPWIGTELVRGITVEQRLSSVDSRYRAQTSDGRNLTARFIRIHRLTTPPDWMTRASRLRMVDSRRLASFVDAIEHDEYAVVLSEYVEGERLNDCLRRVGALGPRQALEIAEQVAIALEGIHDNGLLHCRLTSRDVLVTTDARGALKATVVSYGLATTLEPGITDAAYLPAEHDPCHPLRSDDIFSIGALLFEMLTGVGPRQGVVEAEIRDIAPSPLKNPSAVNVALRAQPALDALVHELTTPERRFATVGAALERIGDLRDDIEREHQVDQRPETFSGARDTGLGVALRTNPVGGAPTRAEIVLRGVPHVVEVHGPRITLRDPQKDKAPITLFDLADHSLTEDIVCLEARGALIWFGTSHGSLGRYDFNAGRVRITSKGADGSMIVALHVGDDLAVAATRRGAVTCFSTAGVYVVTSDSRVKTVTAAASGLRFAVGLASGSVEVYDVIDGGLRRVHDFAAAEVTALKLSADGGEIWLSDRDTTTVRDLSTGTSVAIVDQSDELIETSTVIERLTHDFDD